MQHLARRSDQAGEISDHIKIFLDRGVVPLVLVGDELSLPMFRRNQKLSARLGTPLQLEPLRPATIPADIDLFKSFCRRYDEALMSLDLLRSSPGLGKKRMLDPLLEVSKGHVGRVARLIKEALPAAIWRGADTIEAYDLSRVTHTYAIGNHWIDWDPWSSGAAAPSAS